MKIIAVFFAIFLVGVWAQTTPPFKAPPNCMGQEETMPKQQKCVTTGSLCGGGQWNQVTGKCVCNDGYMAAGKSGKICIPRCIGDTQSCAVAGGSCDAVNFCNCGPGKSFSGGQCIDSKNDKCGGKCYLGTCQSDGSCVCPQDYQLNADKTNCEPIADCPYYSVAILPNLCQCMGDSYYQNDVCVNAPTTPAPTTPTTPAPTTTTTVDISTSSSTIFYNSSTVEPECSCQDIQSVMKQILDELSKLENGM